VKGERSVAPRYANFSTSRYFNAIFSGNQPHQDVKVLRPYGK